jgi:hypothetical protein
MPPTPSRDSDLSSGLEALVAALHKPGAIPEDDTLPALLRRLEPGFESPVLSAARSLRQAVCAYPSVLPSGFTSELMSLVADQSTSGGIRLRILWILDVCATRLPCLADFATFCLARDTSPDIRSHLASHTLPMAIVDGPVSSKTQRLLHLAESVTSDDCLPPLVAHASRWHPGFEGLLPADVAVRLAQARAALLDRSRLIERATAGGVFSPEAWAVGFIASIAPDHDVEGLIESLAFSPDPEMRAVLADALVGWPGDISDPLDRALLESAWRDDLDAAVIQSVMDRRHVNVLLGGPSAG